VKVNHALALALAAVLPACMPSHRAAPALTAPSPIPEAAPLDPQTSARVAAEVAAIFAALPPEPAPADAVETEVSWDIDVASYDTHDRVAHYLRLFQGGSRDYLESRLRRGTRYDAMIRAKLRASDLPEDLAYLPFVESGYDPNAYSRAAAVGMWQFMATTARAVGLRVDWWVDERRDPVRSTDAATRYLRDLRRQLGSVYLAVAAYNGGSGRISRGLAKYADDLDGTTGDDLFFALAETGHLRRETREYVPQLIAVAMLAKEPARYGLEVGTVEPFAYDSATVPAATPLAAVAAAGNTTVDAIRDLNPHFLRGLTPPGAASQVRVPVGAGAGFAARFAALPEKDRRGVTRVSTTKGQTMASIARAHDLAERRLAWYNPTVRRAKPSGRLVSGQTILVPSAAVVRAAVDVPDPSIERYGSSTKPATRTHTVRAGESLSVIGRRYGTSVTQLKKANGLQSDRIKPGQRLVVPAQSTSDRGAD